MARGFYTQWPLHDGRRYSDWNGAIGHGVVMQQGVLSNRYNRDATGQVAFVRAVRLK